jgi:hypothetical protein
VLVTLKLYLADGRERQLSHEVAEDELQTPRAILERMSRDGRLALGDREACDLAEVERVEVVSPEPERAPPWVEDGKPPGARLRDEDVAAALRERRMGSADSG